MKWRDLDSQLPDGMRVCETGTGMRAIVSRDDGKWHLSVSRPNRYPVWDEIKQTRYDLIPDNVYMAMILPPKDDFVDVHPNCFHLWEILSDDEQKALETRNASLLAKNQELVAINKALEHRLGDPE